MALTINLRKMLHRKSPEFCAPLPGGNTVAGGFIVSDKSNLIPAQDTAYYVGGASAIWNYQADDDAWVQIPNSGIAGSFGGGACGEFRAVSAPGGAITLSGAAGGTTTKINTTLTLVRNLKGCAIHIIGGAGIGFIGTIKSNTIGANAVIELSAAAGAATDATTQFRLYAGSLWFFNPGATPGFAVLDRATNAWTQRSVTGLPAWGTDGQLVSIGGLVSNGGAGFVNGTAAAGGASTLTDGTKTWPVNGWANFQVRITAGTGAGQIRSIASNTATVLTVSSAWTTQPDATSQYRIEGNDDYLYLLGNNAVTMYRYSISGNAWTTLAPTAARGGAMASGGTADWIDGVPDALWTDGSYGTVNQAGTLLRQNGRYIYSFRGGLSSALDIFDIALTTWISAHPYGNQMETFTTGSCSVDKDGYIYIQKDATGRIYKFDVAENALEAFTQSPMPQGTVVTGDKMFMTTYADGGSKLSYLYSLGHTRAELTRWAVI